MVVFSLRVLPYRTCSSPHFNRTYVSRTSGFTANFIYFPGILWDGTEHVLGSFFVCFLLGRIYQKVGLFEFTSVFYKF